MTESSEHSAAILEIPLLKHLSEDQRAPLLAAGAERSLEKGEILFHEGEPAVSLYAVIAGRMKLVRYSLKGKEMLVHLVRPGQSFAEAALFGKGTYPATAEAVEASRLWSLSRERLVALTRSSPDLAIAMVASVSMWTRRLVGQLELLTQRRVEERVAIYILGRAGGRNPRAGEWVQLNEARHLIAAQCGTAPEVLSRTFKRLEEEGLINPEPHRVQILDPERLNALAEWIGE